MTRFALLTGIYAYAIFFLGLGTLLTPFPLALLTSIYVLALVIVMYNSGPATLFSLSRLDRGSILLLSLFLVQLIINVIGMLGPEYAFDAVWYHLVLPKLYLAHHAIYHIPGGLLYYSDMPKLGELLYIPALEFSTETLAKGIQLLFGLCTCLLLYQYLRSSYSRFLSLLGVLIFYGNIVVAWESTVAYIDLIRTFYEFFVLLVFLSWYKNRKIQLLLLSSVLLGLAITTKLLSLGSLLILGSMVFFSSYEKRKELFLAWKNTCLFVITAAVIPLPWFIFSFIFTKNPVYPFFTSLYPTQLSWSLLNPVTFFSDIFTLFTHAADPLSPVYLIFFPFLFLFGSFRKEIKLVTIYSLSALFIWYITPRTGGGRFMLAYLPGFSLIAIEILFLMSKQKKYLLYRYILIGSVICLALSTIVYRSFATSKYIPYMLGKESKQSFLIRHLNFSFGDFYDIDGKIKQMLKPSDTVLLVGFHNLYYVDFPFIDRSFIQKGDRFTYIATQFTTLPKEYINAHKVYEEKRTGVILYKVGEKRWGIN